LDESCGVQLLLWIGHVEQVVRRTRALLRRRLGGAGVESPVALLRIGGDDFAVELLRQLDRERRLSRRRRAADGEHPVHGMICTASRQSSHTRAFGAGATTTACRA